MEYTTTIGIDMGDKIHHFCQLDGAGEIVDEGTFGTTEQAVLKFFARRTPALVALEAGTHSPWVSRLLEAKGHRVLVGNSRKLRLIWNSDEKHDPRDARMLARIARFDPQLLYPIRHRGEQAQADLALLKARDALVAMRTKLINHARGAVKAMGQRLPCCSAAAFAKKVRGQLPPLLADALAPIIETISELTARIRAYDKKIDRVSRERYEETARLRTVPGVGPITALAYVLTLEDERRFERSRSVPAFAGLTPRRDQSGQVDRQLGITRAGNEYLRRLLVSCAQYIMGPFAPDCALRRWGDRLALRGGKNAKKRAVVAVARKLAVVVHRIWVTGQDFEPFPDPPPRRRGSGGRRRRRGAVEMTSCGSNGSRARRAAICPTGLG